MYGIPARENGGRAKEGGFVVTPPASSSIPCASGAGYRDGRRGCSL